MMLGGLWAESPRATGAPEPLGPVRNADGLILTYYGDDFTGSVDVMEALTANGIRTVLFLEVPARDQVLAYPGIGAVGVAGISRTMAPNEMDDALPSIFDGLKQLGAPLFHYKICSTFDSSPSIGSVGRAIEVARRIFGERPMPLLVGAPILGRYTVFGNLFAKADGVTCRLDRHPTMTTHPVTPMHESDLRINLEQQTNLPLALIDVLALAGTPSELESAVDAVVEAGAQVVLLDVLDDHSEREVGGILDRFVRHGWSAESPSPQVVIGSSGVEYALTSHWNCRADTPEAPSRPAITSSQTLVVAGSRAPATEAQITYSLEHGFVSVEVDAVSVTDPARCADARADVVHRAVTALATGAHVLVHTPRRSVDIDGGGTALAKALGEIVLRVGLASAVRRLVVAGGDTSGLVARSLGIKALEILWPLTTGAPLCHASSTQPRFDGMEVCLKSGQIGAADYFVRIANLDSRI